MNVMFTSLPGCWNHLANNLEDSQLSQIVTTGTTTLVEIVIILCLQWNLGTQPLLQPPSKYTNREWYVHDIVACYLIIFHILWSAQCVENWDCAHISPYLRLSSLATPTLNQCSWMFLLLLSVARKVCSCHFTANWNSKRENFSYQSKKCLPLGQS